MGMDTRVHSASKIVKLDSGVGSDIVGGIPRALLVGTAGTATVLDAQGNTCTDLPLQAGYNPIQIKRISSLGTAANIWGLW